MAAGFFRRFSKIFLVLLNIGLAVAFLLGCYAGYFNPTHFWFIGLFTLGALYLFFALLFFICFWFIAKKKLMTISIIAIVLAWMPMRQILKLRTSNNFAVAKDAKSLRVMSWNVAQFNIAENKTHPEVKTKMFDLINEYQPDVACFQELAGGDKDAKAINYVPAISKALNYSNYNFSYSVKNDYDSKHHFGIITFSRYPIIKKQTYYTRPDDYNFIFQSVDILKNEDTIRVFNVHLQTLRFDTSNLRFINEATTASSEIDLQKSKNVISRFKTSFLKRKIQSEGIQKAISESPYPVVVCGDFNDVPNSYAYSTIGKGLNNAFAEKGSGIGRTFSGISPTLRIDNIFTDKKFDVLQYTCIPKKLSDHFPIMADLNFAK
jgi:endonuclease/exonuclease/phosphatase family metal-dependent hydrolase